MTSHDAPPTASGPNSRSERGSISVWMALAATGDDHSGRAGGRSAAVRCTRRATRHRHRRPGRPGRRPATPHRPRRSAATTVPHRPGPGGRRGPRLPRRRRRHRHRPPCAAAPPSWSPPPPATTPSSCASSASTSSPSPAPPSPAPSAPSTGTNDDRYPPPTPRPRSPPSPCSAIVIGLPGHAPRSRRRPHPRPAPLLGPGDVGVAAARTTAPSPWRRSRSSAGSPGCCSSAAIVVELVARLRGGTAPRLPGLRLPQWRARNLVAAAALLFIAAPLLVHHQLPADAQPTATHGQIVPAAPTVAAAGRIERRPHTAAGIRDRRPCPYTVRRGDTLWSIAEQHLGSGARYPVVVDLNAARPRRPTLISSTRHRPPTSRTARPGREAPAAHRVIVERGDTLSGIAAENSATRTGTPRSSPPPPPSPNPAAGT